MKWRHAQQRAKAQDKNNNDNDKNNDDKKGGDDDSDNKPLKIKTNGSTSSKSCNDDKVCNPVENQNKSVDAKFSTNEKLNTKIVSKQNFEQDKCHYENAVSNFDPSNVENGSKIDQNTLHFTLPCFACCSQ